MIKFERFLFSLFLFSGVALTVCGAENVWAGSGVDLVGAATLGNATGDPTPNTKIGFPGGGILLKFRLGTRVDLALGGLYLKRIYNNTGTENTLDMFEGQVGLRFNLSRALFLGLGAYGNYYSMNPANLAGNDLGGYGGVGVKFPLGPTLGLVMEGQYHFAANQLTDRAGNTITPNELIVMAGFSFGGRRK